MQHHIFNKTLCRVFNNYEVLNLKQPNRSPSAREMFWANTFMNLESNCQWIKWLAICLEYRMWMWLLKPGVDIIELHFGYRFFKYLLSITTPWKCRTVESLNWAIIFVPAGVWLSALNWYQPHWQSYLSFFISFELHSVL